MSDDKEDESRGWGAETPPLKCSNKAEPIRNWIAITIKKHVKNPEQFCLCMLMASLASSWGYFPGGGISAPNNTLSLGFPQPPISHEGMRGPTSSNCSLLLQV